jgi:hypothetical protein
MKELHRTAVLALALAVAALLAACGSSATTTVTVTSTVTESAGATAGATTASSATASSTTTHSTTETTPARSSSSETTSASSATTTSSSETTSTTTTRTETAPAFVPTTPGSAALTAAIAVLARHGYAPVTTSTYQAGDTLRVLVGRRADGAEHAFFFDQTIYLGTDASAASGQIRVLGQNDTEVTLAYGLYQAGAAAPSGEARVRFALDMGQLSALDPLPSVAARR